MQDPFCCGLGQAIQWYNSLHWCSEAMLEKAIGECVPLIKAVQKNSQTSFSENISSLGVLFMMTAVYDMLRESTENASSNPQCEGPGERQHKRSSERQHKHLGERSDEHQCELLGECSSEHQHEHLGECQCERLGEHQHECSDGHSSKCQCKRSGEHSSKCLSKHLGGCQCKHLSEHLGKHQHERLKGQSCECSSSHSGGLYDKALWVTEGCSCFLQKLCLACFGGMRFRCNFERCLPAQ